MQLEKIRAGSECKGAGKQAVIEYRQEKLSVNLKKLGRMKICILGAGAVGSHIAEALYQHGAGLYGGRVTLVDHDGVDGSNYTKQSGLYGPEDLGRPKAIALARRINRIVGNEGYFIPMNTDICELGEAFFSGFDVIFIAVDNFRARLHINKMVRQSQHTPVVITTGTGTDKAESICLDMKRLCTRCLWSESWLEDVTGPKSCRFAYEAQEKAGVIPTSKLLSALAGLLAFSQMNALAEGHEEVLNTRKEAFVSPTGIDVYTSRPLPKQNCPDCAVSVPKSVVSMEGSVFDMTLDTFLKQVRKRTGWDTVWALGDGFLLHDYCPRCGAKKEVYRPARWLNREQLICVQCREQLPLQDLPAVEFVNAYSMDSEPRLREMKLSELGMRPWGYIQVEKELDFWDGCQAEGMVFTLDEQMSDNGYLIGEEEDT